jgi:hypothetical protein
METLLNITALLPLVFIILTNLFFVIYAMKLLRMTRILKTPFAGMEYSEATTAACFMLSVLLITSAVIPAIFQTYKTYYYSLDNAYWVKLNVIKFGQILMVLALFQAIFIIFIWFGAIVTIGLKKLRDELSSGNLPLSLLFSAVLIGFAISVRLCCSAAMDELMPQVMRIN